jgi:group I intron endonuclease
MIIYKYTSPSGKSYIGQTKYDLDVRFKQHVIEAINKESHYMFHQALRKYGPENFESEILEIIEDYNNIDEREKHWISYYDTYNNGYNMTEGGYGRPYDWKHSDESKQKMSEYAKNRADEHKAKISESLKGRNPWNKGLKLTEDQKKSYGHKHSEETKQKLSNLKKGTKHSEETKQKISQSSSGENNGMYGKTHSEETKRKMSERAKLRKVSDESKQKMSESRKGKKRGPYKKKET